MDSPAHMAFFNAIYKGERENGPTPQKKKFLPCGATQLRQAKRVEKSLVAQLSSLSTIKWNSL